MRELKFTKKLEDIDPYVFQKHYKKYEDIVYADYSIENEEDNGRFEQYDFLEIGQIQDVVLNNDEMNLLIANFINYLDNANRELSDKIINFNIQYINNCYNITLNLNEDGNENDFLTILTEFYNFSPFNIISFNQFGEQQ